MLALTISLASVRACASSEMMRHLREVNVDNNTVGWYTSTYLSSFLSESLIHDQFNYQTTISKCVVVVYDPLKVRMPCALQSTSRASRSTVLGHAQTNQGELSLKAYRLSDAFIELYSNEDFSAARLVWDASWVWSGLLTRYFSLQHRQGWSLVQQHF